jgi:hypothetical protein
MKKASTTTAQATITIAVRVEPAPGALAAAGCHQPSSSQTLIALLEGRDASPARLKWRKLRGEYESSERANEGQSGSDPYRGLPTLARLLMVIWNEAVAGIASLDGPGTLQRKQNNSRVRTRHCCAHGRALQGLAQRNDVGGGSFGRAEGGGQGHRVGKFVLRVVAILGTRT